MNATNESPTYPVTVDAWKDYAWKNAMYASIRRTTLASTILFVGLYGLALIFKYFRINVGDESPSLLALGSNALLLWFLAVVAIMLFSYMGKTLMVEATRALSSNWLEYIVHNADDVIANDPKIGDTAVLQERFAAAGMLRVRDFLDARTEQDAKARHRRIEQSLQAK